MRLWTTLSLIAVAVGCAGKEESTPAAKPPTAEHGGHAMPSNDGHGEHGGHEKMKMSMATPRARGRD